MIGQMASAMKERLSIRYPGMSHLKSVAQGSEFSVNTKINITNDNNRGIIQMRGSGSRVAVSNDGKITINTATTGGFRLQGDSSQIHVSSGGQISVKMAGDGDQPGNNGMRFVGKGLSLIVEGAGSVIDIDKQSGRSSAVRFENGTQKLTVAQWRLTEGKKCRGMANLSEQTQSRKPSDPIL